MKILNILALAMTVLLSAGPASSGILDQTATQLPEPGTLALLAGGVAAALLIRGRKK